MKNLRYFDTLAEALILELKDVAAQDAALEEMQALSRAFLENPEIRDRVLHASSPLAKRLEWRRIALEILCRKP